MELIKNLKEVSLVKNLFLAIRGTIVLAISAKVTNTTSNEIGIHDCPRQNRP